jgi:hypothetical protein
VYPVTAAMYPITTIRLTVCLYRKRKCIEELTIASDDSDDQEDKVTTMKEKKNKQP